MRNDIRFAALSTLVLALTTLVLLPPASGEEKSRKDSKVEKKPEDSKGAAPELTPEQQAEMEAWMKAGMMGPEHKQLEPFVGTWTVTAKMWMPPSEQAMESSGKATFKPVLGGRFVRQEFSGEFMGMPFEGIGYIGYDNIQKKYITYWMDSMSTGTMQETGSYDAAKKTFLFQGEFTDPTGKKIKGRGTLEIRSPTEIIHTGYHTQPGQPESKVMELTYRRDATPAGTIRPKASSK